MTDRNSSRSRHRKETPVRLQLAGADAINAFVYLVHEERLVDLLNDPRRFIPIKREDGGVFIVAKSQIVSLEEIKRTSNRKNSEREIKNENDVNSVHFDPYAVLRVSRNAGTEEIRAAYKARIKSVHPDTVAALGLGEELAQAALHASQKVNYAYRKIMNERRAAQTAA